MLDSSHPSPLFRHAAIAVGVLSGCALTRKQLRRMPPLACHGSNAASVNGLRSRHPSPHQAGSLLRRQHLKLQLVPTMSQCRLALLSGSAAITAWRMDQRYEYLPGRTRARRGRSCAWWRSSAVLRFRWTARLRPGTTWTHCRSMRPSCSPGNSRWTGFLRCARSALGCTLARPGRGGCEATSPRELQGRWKVPPREQLARRGQANGRDSRDNCSASNRR